MKWDDFLEYRLSLGQLEGVYTIGAIAMFAVVLLVERWSRKEK